MIKINFHTHTNRCRHADGIAADYVQSALSAGVTQLGFSDHAPFPDYDFGMRMPYCELSEYIEDINALTVQYRTDIDRKSTRLNSSHRLESRMPSSA